MTKGGRLLEKHFGAEGQLEQRLDNLKFYMEKFQIVRKSSCRRLNTTTLKTATARRVRWCPTENAKLSSKKLSTCVVTSASLPLKRCWSSRSLSTIRGLIFRKSCFAAKNISRTPEACGLS